MATQKSIHLTDTCPTCGQAELRLHQKLRTLTNMATCFSCLRTFYENVDGMWIETSNSRTVAGSLKPSPVDRATMRTIEKERVAWEKHESLRDIRGAKK